MSKIWIALVAYLGLIALGSGKPFNSERIVGGENALEGSFAYQVSLRFDGSHTCGASIISRSYVLSAAHCVGDDDDTGNYFVYPASYFTIRAGSTDRLRGGVVVSVSSIYVNEAYSDFLHDLSLLKLETRLIFSQNIQPIELPTGAVPTGGQVVISGWGRLSTSGDVPTKLQWNTANTVSKLSCLTTIGRYTDDLLCLNNAVNNGACFGDSGGPAAYQGQLVGVASFVVGGCGSGSPDGYASVYSHVDWIRQHSDA